MSSTAFKRPSFRLIGKPGSTDDNIRSLPDLLEFNKVHNPDHLFCIQALSQNEEFGKAAKPITFGEFERAVRRCCRWIEKQVGSASVARELAEKRQPIALYVESNVGLFTLILALLSLNIPVS